MRALAARLGTDAGEVDGFTARFPTRPVAIGNLIS
jgi:hypothetical protein